MKKLTYLTFICLTVTALAACGGTHSHTAEEHNASDHGSMNHDDHDSMDHGDMEHQDMILGENGSGIQVKGGFARVTDVNGAIYFQLVNTGDSADTLVGAETTASETTELHETVIGDDDVMKMTPMESFDLPAGETVSFEPGGKHVMLIGVQGDLAKGDTVNLTLNFANSDSIEIAVDVQGALTGHGDHHHMDSDDDKAMDMSHDETMDGEHSEDMDMSDGN